jgi:hypothetical protein
VLCGHEHFYERLQERGIPYVTLGLSGNSTLYDFATPVPGSVLRFQTKLGALRIAASDQQLVSQFVTTDGNVVDTLHLP